MTDQRDNEGRLPPMESGILTAMAAIDKQIRREMQRSPAEREAQGVQKWEPFQKRIELITSFVMNSLGEGDVQLDSLLVLSQAMTKALELIAAELGAEELGEVRAAYVAKAFEVIAESARRGLQAVGPESELQ